MECSFSKAVLIIINVIFLIFGLAILIAGVVFKVGFDVFKDALEAQIEGNTDFDLKYAGETLGWIVIIFGCFIILLAGMGCCGACCQSKILLGIYGTVIAVLLLAEVIAVAVVLVKGNEATDLMKKGLLKGIDGYHDNVANKNAKDKAFDAIFSTFKCCGVNNYTDFQSSNTDWDKRNTETKIPVACCHGINYEDIKDATFNNADVKHCLNLDNPTKDYAYTEGCVQDLLDYVLGYKYVAIGVGVTIFLIQLLTCLMAFCLCCRKDDDYKV